MASGISLQRQLDHLNRAQHHARIGSFEHDLHTGATFWSDEQYRLLGFTPGDVTPSLDIFLDFRPILSSTFDELLENLYWNDT